MPLQPSAKAPDIPPEIWLHVAQFIPCADLCSMFNINRVFFQLSMDARYYMLSFGVDSDAKALWRLYRVRDPSISHRVRKLRINLQDGKLLFRQFNEGGYLNPGRNSISLLEGIQIMTETVACLTNVTDFSVNWMAPSPRKNLVPFLTLAWKSFGSGLCILSFQVSLKNLAALLSTADGFVSLRNLYVKVIGEEFVDIHGEALSTTLAPFINKVAPTLRTLSYSSSSNHLDPSTFFCRLENIPNLEQLHIFVENHGNILTDPFGTTRFILDHATTLRHLEWGQSGPSGGQQFMYWLCGNNLEVFTNLCTLWIRFPERPGGFILGILHLSCSEETSSWLELFDDDMTYEKAHSMISLFAPQRGGNLKEFSLEVKFLSPELILLLAQTLPGLEKLTIRAAYFTGHEAGKRSPEAIRADNYNEGRREERLNAGIFVDTMKTYDIRGWVLRDIDIDLSFRWDSRLPKKLMWVLAECVPSVEKFGGEYKELCARDLEDRL